MDLTKELLQKAKKAESAEALLALAKENGMEMTQEEADAYFAELHKTGELSDDELENVTGGGCRKKGHLVVTVYYSCDLWACHAQPYRSSIRNGQIDCCWCRNINLLCSVSKCCKDCYYCHYENGLWLCYNPKK